MTWWIRWLRWLRMNPVYLGLTLLGAVLLEALLWVFRSIRQAAFRPFSGRYYAYKGNPIDIHEEDNGQRWLSVRDVRRSWPGLPRDAVLQRSCGLWLERCGEPALLRLEASALEGLLKHAQEAETIRFLRWLQRTVIFPARQKASRQHGRG